MVDHGKRPEHEAAQEVEQKGVRSSWQAQVPDPRQGTCPKCPGEGCPVWKSSRTKEGESSRKKAISERRQKIQEEVISSYENRWNDRVFQRTGSGWSPNHFFHRKDRMPRLPM